MHCGRLRRKVCHAHIYKLRHTYTHAKTHTNTHTDTQLLLLLFLLPPEASDTICITTQKCKVERKECFASFFARALTTFRTLIHPRTHAHT